MGGCGGGGGGGRLNRYTSTSLRLIIRMLLLHLKLSPTTDDHLISLAAAASLHRNGLPHCCIAVSRTRIRTRCYRAVLRSLGMTIY